MRMIPLVAFAAALAACYSYNEPPIVPTAEPPWGEPTQVQGPPGGAMDPGYGPDEAAAAGGQIEGQPESQIDGQDGELGAQIAPQEPGAPGIAEGGAPDGEPGSDTVVGVAPAPGAAIEGAPSEAAPTSSVTDAEIDATLSPYGDWVETEDYGRVWRPNATVVGVDFTPYETCGKWVFTEHGWTFTCDWNWGWLPFHYGQWAWVDNSWCWARDYTWSPAWVEWRSGGGYVGWRPLAPRWRGPRGAIVRDHRRGTIVRDHRRGTIVRDHRRPRDSDWRFTRESDLGRTRIRPGLYRNVAEGIRVTSSVRQPGVRGSRVATADVMRPRFQGRMSGGVRVGPSRAYDPGRYQRGGEPGRYQRGYPSRAYQPYQPSRGYQRGYQAPSRDYQRYQAPSRGQAPSRDYQRPSRGAYQAPSRDYQRPSRGGYQAPSRGYQAPSTRTYSPSPSTRSYSPSPSTRSYSPPTRSYSPPTRSYSPPSSGSSRSSSPSSGSSRSHSSGGSSSRRR